MKKTFLFILCTFFVGTFLLIAQEEQTQYVSENWGDYYFVNDDFQKAVNFYSNSEFPKDLKTTRNWALALSILNREKEAEQQYDLVANSTEARVEDYYNYADLLLNKEQLAKEYREKAFLLPWPTPALFEDDSLLYKKRFGRDSYKIKPVQGNSNRSEFGMVFLSEAEQSSVFYLSEQDKSKAGKKVFKRIKTDYPVYNFHKAIFDKKDFSLKSQEELRNPINSLFQEGPASYSADSDLFYFTRSANQLDKKKTVQLNLYQIKLSEINDNKTPQALTINIDGFSSIHPSMSPSGKYLYFASDRPGGFGGMDIYRTTVVKGVFSTPINLGADINTAGDEVFPYSYDDCFLFYSSNGKEGVGEMDIYLAENRIEKRWETYLLGSGINTNKDDFSFGLNEKLAIGYLSSNRSEGKGEDDLFAFDFNPTIEGVRDAYEYVPSDTLVVAMNHVLVNDQKYLEQRDPLQRLIKKKVELSIAPKFGTLKLNANGSFYYKNTQPIQAKDSFAYRLNTIKGVSEEVWVNLDRALVKKEDLSVPLQTVLLPIFYNLDDSSILENYLNRADVVVEVMNQNPTLEVELSSYTDCRGAFAYNLNLSKRRTQVIIDYVRERISNPERIYGAGYGEVTGESKFKEEYALIAGSFGLAENAQILIKLFKEKGLEPTLFEDSSRFRVSLAQKDSKTEIMLIKNNLESIGVSTWILSNPCNEVSEKEHQTKRRTDINVIRL